MSPNNQLLFSLGYCLLLLMIALLFQKFQPKKINWIYGYRTQRSMRNQTIWRAANAYASKTMVKVCLYGFLLPALLFFLYDTHLLVITLVGHTLLVALVILFTELYLDKHFHSDGTVK